MHYWRFAGRRIIVILACSGSFLRSLTKAKESGGAGLGNAEPSQWGAGFGELELVIVDQAMLRNVSSITLVKHLYIDITKGGGISL